MYKENIEQNPLQTDNTGMDYTRCCTLADCSHETSNEAQKIKNAKRGDISFFLIDNLEFMKQKPDNYYDLALVDPPYGIGQNWAKDKRAKFYKHRNNFNDNIPGEEYFKELFRVSKYQIIWGANYYWNYLRPSNNLIFWDKGKDAQKQFGSAGEIAWTNITKYPLVKVELMWNGCCVCEKTERVHPHQKPVKLYQWTLQNFAEKGWKILDTHGGSMSNAIACDIEGFQLDICENDEKYFNDGLQRFDLHKLQLKLF
ncbi:MAG: site-specific DNA-methyltransferase [Patescibacteria group bacterium]|nr:site-specific DNA-methyltransferase [Patescibacteria group bacterium]